MLFKKLKKNDYEILRIMVEKGTTNSKIISKELSISDKTIRNRISIMKNLNVFKKAIVINSDVFGYKFKIDFFLKVNKSQIEECISWLFKKYKHNIVYLGRHWGYDSISMQCVFKDGKKVEDFEKRLREKREISDFEMSIVPKVFKDTYDWRPDQSHFNITPKGLEELQKRREKQKQN